MELPGYFCTTEAGMMCLQHGPVQELCNVTFPEKTKTLCCQLAAALVWKLHGVLAWPWDTAMAKFLIRPAYKQRACKESQCAEAMSGS